jgi:hypothetical protein
MSCIIITKGCSEKRLSLKFNVFHVRALHHTKTLITNRCIKRVLSSIVTHSYMFRPCWVIFRDYFSLLLYYGCTLQLSENVLLTEYCVVFGGVTPPRSRRAGWDRGGFTPAVHSTQSTAHSHSTVKYNLSVTVTKSFSPEMTQQDRNM